MTLARIQRWIHECERGEIWRTLVFWGTLSWLVFSVVAFVWGFSCVGAERQGMWFFAAVCAAAFVGAWSEFESTWRNLARDGLHFEFEGRPVKVVALDGKLAVLASDIWDVLGASPSQARAQTRAMRLSGLVQQRYDEFYLFEPVALKACAQHAALPRAAAVERWLRAEVFR